MSNLMDLLSQIEKLAYSLAIWIILIPKTVLKIFFDPAWVRGYVAKEFAEYAEAEKAGSKSAEKVRFDDYISPVILLLLCSLVPYVGMQFLPNYGFVNNLFQPAIQRPPSCTEKNPCTYQVEGDYLADSSAYTVEWQCREEPGTEAAPTEGKRLQDSAHTVADQATCTWMTPGTKQVYVAILLYGEEVIDDSDILVEVKASAVGAGEIPVPATAQPVSEATDVENNTETPNNGEQAKDFVDGLKKNTYLGIFFLLPALAFSLVISGFKDDRPIWQRTTSAESLKEIFYAQCYYFAPISLFTFVMLYSFLFSTVKVRGTSFLALFAFLGMWFWFYQVEVTAVLQERKSKNKLVAHLIVLSTIIVLVIASWNILLIDPETLRLRAYELLKYGIYFVFFYQLILRRIINWWKNRRNEKAGVPPSNKKAGVSPSLVDRLPKSGIQN